MEKSPLLMRQWDLLNPDNVKEITIVGAGGIGSTTAFILAKMGFTNIKIYDFDTVEQYNVASQMYRVKDIGKPKVEALKEIIEEASGVSVEAINEAVKGVDTQVLILAVDSIEVRRKIVENSTFEICLDGRMGAETFNVYSFLEGEKELYGRTIFEKAKATQVPCTGKVIAYNTFGVGSLLAALVKKFANAEDMPFEQSFCYQNLFLATQTVEEFEKFNPAKV